MTKVTTTIQPGKVITVGASELLDLERQGLVATYPDREKKAETAQPREKK